MAISTTTSGAAIHYTIDGSTPTASSATYGAAIQVGTSMTVKAIATATGYTDSAVGSAAYVINTPLPVAATPTFSPAAGTFTSAQSVAISTTTSGAAIHYTTDNSTPTASSPTYAGAILVGASMTVKAIATATGYTDSAIGSAAYVITIPLPVAATPTFSPAGGTYTSTQSVTLATTTSGAAIHYTTDGSTPTASSTTYTSAISVSATTTVKAIATATGYTSSAVGSALYTINVTLSGIGMPQEVSAIPTGSGVNTQPVESLRAGAWSHVLANLPADSDYAKAKTFKFVVDQDLSVFDILNTVFNAMSQIHYEDSANVNKGPYKAIVSWTENDSSGQGQKYLYTWVVDSKRASNTDPSVVSIWMRQPVGKAPVGLSTILVKVTITRAPVLNADGSCSDYGEWRIDARLAELDPVSIPGAFRFVATAGAQAGSSVVVMEKMDDGNGLVRGVLHKSATSGYGKVRIPDPNVIGSFIGKPYAYDSQYVTLKSGTNAPVTFARNSYVDVVNRYGLYDKTTGADVSKTKNFGFPIRATINGTETFGYYGAWQGQHQVWANGSTVPAGVPVTRADVAPGQSAPQYTTSEVFTGILTKRTYAPASLSDLTGIVVQSYDSTSYMIGYDGKWYTNPDLVPAQGQPTAARDATSVDFTDFASLVNNPSDTQRSIVVFQVAGPPKYFVYLVDYPTVGNHVDGFYLAQLTGPQPVRDPSATTPTVFQSGSWLQVNVGGPVYVSWNGTTWVKKKVVAFDLKTWTPTFDPAGDTPYTLQDNREYYLNNSGTNYVVKRSGGNVSVQLEIQTVAHPSDAASLIPSGTVFSPQFFQPGTSPSTYSFVTAAGSQSFMKLVYATVSESDASNGVKVGDVVTTSLQGLTATVGGATVQFNWQYPLQGQMGGVQQFLLESGGSYKMLDNPIQLESVTLTNPTGSRTFTLQFDGNWMQGLPNVMQDLTSSGFKVTQALKDRSFAVPTGTEIGSYIVKQLQISEFKEMLPSATALDLAAAKALNLSNSVSTDGLNTPGFQTVLEFADPGMAPDVPIADLKYSEGKPVTP